MKKSYYSLEKYFSDISAIAEKIDKNLVLKLIKNINNIKKRNGRMFFIGVGGSAGNCSHAVNDFRKLCNIECYSPIDNVSELTARINDEGWNSSMKEWLKVSNIKHTDAIFVFSVGGGNLKRNVSVNLIEAMKFAKIKKTKIFGIVGKKNSFAKKIGDCILEIPEVDPKYLTPYSESFQAVIWHAIVSHPILQENKTKW
jgi:D-sedoheptulose 7-phosphate isomerase